MARILVHGAFYEAVSWRALYESEFERIVLSQSANLFPNHILIPFKMTVYADEGSAKADFALVEKDYREWWVIEAEMADHSLNSHVLPQVRTLSRAKYSDGEARYLADRCKDVDFDRLADMMKGRQPKVLVIVNGDKPEWKTSLAAHSAQLMVLEIYRSIMNKHAFWIRGGRLAELADVVSSCRFDPILPRFLIVDSPSALDLQHNQSVSISFEEAESPWTRIDVGDKVWLTPQGTGNLPIPVKQEYHLIRLSDGKLIFESKK